jgi:hypothetical protein
MSSALVLFGEHAFRKWPEDSEELYPVNRALFDVWSVKLSEIPPAAIAGSARAIVRRFRKMMTDDSEFISAISTGTSSPQKVILRFGRIDDLLARAI